MDLLLDLLSYAFAIGLAVVSLVTIGAWLVREASVDERGFARQARPLVVERRGDDGSLIGERAATRRPITL